MRNNLFLFLIFILPLFLNAQKPLKDPAEFKKKFAEASQKLTSIESSFVQEKHLTMMEETIRTKGKFYFKKENKLRWEYTEPFRYLFILNNGKIFIKDESRQNSFDVSSNKMFSEINSILIGSVQGTLLNDTKNFSSSFSETTTTWIARLKPRSGKLTSYLSEIVITFDKTDCSVVRLEMIEPSGDFTIIDFNAKKLNTLSTDEKFIVQ